MDKWEERRRDADGGWMAARRHFEQSRALSLKIARARRDAVAPPCLDQRPPLDLYPGLMCSVCPMMCPDRFDR